MIMTVPGDHLGSCSKRPLGQDVVPEAPKHVAKSSVIVGGRTRAIIGMSGLGADPALWASMADTTSLALSVVPFEAGGNLVPGPDGLTD
jgi:hypothetical protein